MRFARPEFLFLLFLPPMLYPFLYWHLCRRRRLLERFGDPGLIDRLIPRIPWEWRFLRASALALAVGLFGIALAEPQWGSRLETVRRRGVDVVIALDSSLSMLAEDLPPNRLLRARAAVATFLDHLRGDRVGLVAFAGTSYIHCPLTSDYSAVRTFLEILEPDLLPVSGTAIGGAIRTALSAFPEGNRKYQVILMLTDGEDSDSDPLGAAREAAHLGVRIFTIGIGSTGGGLIPLKAGPGRVAGYKKDRTGQLVMSRLDEDTLEEVARITGGNYYRSTTAEWEMERVAETIGAMEKKDFEDRSLARLEHRYRIPLFLALVFLGLETCLPANWRRSARWPAAARTAGGLLIALLLTAAAPARAAPGARQVREGNRLYREGDYPEALEVYSEARRQFPEVSEIRYNLANVLYRQGKFQEAIEEYRRSRSGAGPRLVQAAQYNIGNALFRLGRFQDAAHAYEQALRLDPGDLDAKRNLEISLERLREAEREAPEEPGRDPSRPESPEPADGGPEPDPQPRPAPGGRPAAEDRSQGGPMTREQALRILSALQEDEKESLRRGIRVPGTDTPWERDW